MQSKALLELLKMQMDKLVEIDYQKKYIEEHKKKLMTIQFNIFQKKELNTNLNQSKMFKRQLFVKFANLIVIILV